MVSEEVIRNSFDNVKVHIKSLEVEINQLKAKISKIEAVLEEIRLELKNQKKVAPKDEDQTSTQENFDFISSGNKGVQSIITNNHQYNSIPNTQSPMFINLKKELELVFRTLTDREFSIFMVVYAIDKEGKEANYQEIAKQLGISDHTIRGYVSSLISKNVPIQKERYLNGKVSLSIKNEFKQLDLYQKLLKLRLPNSNQKTLFDL